MVLLYYEFPSFVADSSVRNLLGVGTIAVAAQTLFTVRGGTSEARQQTRQLLEERQIQAEKGEMPKVSLFPEGATTNSSCMLRFKKGAFASLKPVKPIVLKYKQHFTNKIMWTQDVVGFLKHQLVSGSYGMITVKVDFLPVFAPNDYFWEHHWKKDGKDK